MYFHEKPWGRLCNTLIAPSKSARVYTDALLIIEATGIEQQLMSTVLWMFIKTRNTNVPAGTVRDIVCDVRYGKVKARRTQHTSIPGKLLEALEWMQEQIEVHQIIFTALFTRTLSLCLRHKRVTHRVTDHQ